VHWLNLTRQEYVETASSPREYFELFRYAFGPMAAIYAGLSGKASRTAELDAAFLQFITRWNQGTGEGVRIPYEYLLAIARKHDA
jgi:hypothetical protein